MIALWAAPSRADNVADALKLFEEGKALRDEGKWAEACDKFSKSNALNRKPGVQLNLGECAERDNQFRRAWLLYDDAAREYDRTRADADAKLAATPTDEEAKVESARAIAGAKLARERADALSPKLAKVIVRVAEPRTDGLSVRIGDRAVPPAAAIVELLDAGTVVITASAPGRTPFTIEAKAVAGKQVEVDVPALAPLGGGGGGGGDPVADKPKRKASRVRLAFGLGGGGALLLVVSGAVALKARSDYNTAEKQCTRDADNNLVCGPELAKEIDSAGTKADIATAVGIVGGLALAGAVVVYFTAPREGVAVTPMVVSWPSGGGIAISGRF